MDEIYGEMRAVQGDPTGRQRVYQLYYDKPSSTGWSMPYRDATDAENAAEEEAQRMGRVIVWRY